MKIISYVFVALSATLLGSYASSSCMAADYKTSLLKTPPVMTYQDCTQRDLNLTYYRETARKYAFALDEGTIERDEQNAENIPEGWDVDAAGKLNGQDVQMSISVRPAGKCTSATIEFSTPMTLRLLRNLQEAFIEVRQDLLVQE